MPELPEVETTRRDLEGRLTGRTIISVCFGEGSPTPVRDLTTQQMAEALCGQRVQRLTRRGKFLLVHFDSGATLVLHRRMTGNLVLRRSGDPPDAFTRAVMHLDDGHDLRWTDQRRFGTWLLTREPEAALADMGPEPLDDSWTEDHLAAALRGRSAPIKAVLLDQRRVAGLGNIYADEALHQARIHPSRPAGSLTRDEIACLHRAIPAVLRRAIELQGSSAQHHVGGLGQRGSMQDEWRVYRRETQPCLTCATPIVKSRVAGRGTHHCPECQVLGVRREVLGEPPLQHPTPNTQHLRTE